MGRQKKEPKPENSKTVSQWGRLGRIPIDPLKTRYIWDNYYGVPQSVYYLEDNTREMTDDERADFQADRKAYRLRYMKFITEELERRRRGEKDGGGNFIGKKMSTWRSFWSRWSHMNFIVRFFRKDLSRERAILRTGRETGLR